LESSIHVIQHTKQNPNLWKESLSSDDQQCHEYQQNEQSPLIEHKKFMTYDIGNPDPGLGQVQKCDEFKL
jgi:hypothetical protein